MTIKKRDLASFKAALKKSGNTSTTFQNNYYPFYNINFDEKCTVRFIPDKNEDNELAFMVEKLTHELTINGQKRVVPCLKMFGSTECPICKKCASIFKIEGEKSPTGKRLYRKKQHIAQVLVVEDPLPYKEGETKAQGTVKLLNIGYSIHQKIDSAYDDDEMDSYPDDYETGFDFVIKKTKKGEHANYENSGFARRSRALSDEEIAVAEAARIDLATLLPKPLSVEELTKLLEADLNGTSLDETAPPATTSNTSIDPQDNVAAVASFKANADSNVDDGDELLPPPSSDVVEEADDILATLKQMRAAKAKQQSE